MADLGLLSLNISELAPKIKSREVSPVEVAQAATAHAERMQPHLNSFITFTPELALEQAQSMERLLMRGEYLGPLHGIPMGLKDMLCTKDVRTTDGSKPMENFIPEEDATVVAKCRAAGAVILGKENMAEAGSGCTSINPWYGPVHNPWDVRFHPGGSSGGSAANVSAFVTYASLGTDGGGSVRMPSSVCGNVGIKATYGRVSIHGCLEGAEPSTYHVGPHTRSVLDGAIVLRAISGYDPLDPATVPVPVDDYPALLEESIRGLVMGVPRDYFFDLLDPQVRDAVEKAILVLEELGARAQEVTLKDAELIPVLRYLTGGSGLGDIRNRDLYKRENMGEERRMRALQAQFNPVGTYSKGLQLRRYLQREYARLFETVDFLVMPTTPVPAWPIDAASVRVGDQEVDVGLPPFSRDRRPGASSRLLGRLTQLGNVTGAPAVTVPCGFTDAELPIGLQVMGRAWEDTLTLRVAHQYEQVAPPSKTVPPAVAQALN